MRLRWNAEPGLDVTDAAQLDRALDALLAGPAADRPLIAYLAGDAGALGLGLDPAAGGMLLFAPADRGQPALHGIGAGPGTEGAGPGAEDGVVFAVNGRPYRFSGRCRVPAATVRAAARQYLATGELPGCVGWEPEPGAPLTR
jgi:Immunity protein Imm1